MVTISPLMYPEPSLTRNAARLANSSMVPNRPRGIRFFDACCVAHVAGMGVDLAARALAQLLFSGRENFLPAPADINFGAEFQDSLSGSFAQSGAAAGDQDTLALK